ncbi:CBN-STR-79 protein [Caenorhabditis brenneri]|uniref:CBN-STR-79 protein n=1 Tax=Caenorhabditis brenneri TaxID=135651 RepID=G0PD08_CAEBE|nr:CBN-STR-79 protein [Caenorhabditis brenneri]
MVLLSGPFWLQLFEYTELVSLSISLPINSLLLYCILTKSGKEMGNYKYLMAWFTVHSMFYSVITFVTHMGFHIYGGTIMMFTVHNTFDLSNFGVWVLFGICSICAGCVLLILCTQFVYRYFAMNHSKNLKFFTGWRRLFLVILTLFVSVIYGACGFVGINSTPEKDLRIRQAMADAYGVSPDAVHYMGIEYFERKETNEIVVNWISIGAALVVNCYFCTMVTVILYCGIKTYKKVCVKTAHLSNHMYIQRQLFIALLVQTLTPTVLIFIPCMVFYVVPLFEYPMGVDSNIVSISLVTYPMIDPIGVMFIIKNYRTFVKKLFTMKFCCNNKTSSQPEGLIQVKAISENNESLRFNSIQGG